jgi:hypothetical protein
VSNNHLPLFSPLDFRVANKMGAMCGHGALAAAIGLPVLDVYGPFFEGRSGWINVPMMKAAIIRSGHSWARLEKLDEGQTGVILIQFTGPWTNPGVPVAAACLHRHWIATRAGLVWDVNTERWESQDDWKSIVPDLLPERATGYRVWGALKIV